MRIGLTALALVLAACGPTATETTDPSTSETTSETSATETAELTAEEIEAETARLNAWFDEKYEEIKMQVI